ncbi:MAG: UDP-N-acetylglucosamine 1-carboxyvinyltransferase [Eubacterium sp.]|nr:UDP-N-acetylglucosamine 1-carboxyvinyltransferase [Eubacterium sp.]
MNYFEITGGNSLNGEVRLHGAKNSALPILTAAVLVKGQCVIHNCPDLSDVRKTLEILKSLGCSVEQNGSTVIIDAADVNKCYIDESSMRKMRSSILFLGSLLGRLGKADLYLPGGCEIGTRPIDMHLNALMELGACFNENGSYLSCTVKNPQCKRIILPFASVGATENIILYSVLQEGTTIIVNAAREPEIQDLADFINSCGGSVIVSNGEVQINGVKALHSGEHTIIPDRILASTYMSACAATAGDIIIDDVKPTHLAPVFPYFNEMGCRLYLDNRRLRIVAPKRLKRVRKVTTLPFPGFPTDSQSPLVAALTTARGTSCIKETIFENRFRYVSELNRFGADIEINDNLALINGVRQLQCADVFATDLRGGAALIVGALAAQGTSKIYNINFIDRGYEALEKSFSGLNADIKRINDEEREKDESIKECEKICS